MNEAETRAELIDPKLKANSWGVLEGSKILRERNVCKITDGRIQVGGSSKKRIVAQFDALQSETKKLEEIYQQKLENLEGLKKSVLQKAFNGEL